MNNPEIISNVALACAALALVLSGVCIALLAQVRRHAQAHVALATQLEHELADMNTALDGSMQRVTDQARRLAWLETRLAPRVTGDMLVAETNSSLSSKPTMTERRHRVLSLARHGQNSQAIAFTLGMPRGEVELMINLSAEA